ALPAFADGSNQSGHVSQPTVIPASWTQDMNEALKRAQHKNKYVLVDVYTDWCGWCHKLDKETYSAPAVKEYLKQFVLLKINAEDGKDGEAFARQNHIGAYPCIALLDANGNMKGKLYGYRTAAEFPAAIDELISKNASPVSNSANSP